MFEDSMDTIYKADYEDDGRDLNPFNRCSDNGRDLCTIMKMKRRWYVRDEIPRNEFIFI